MTKALFYITIISQVWLSIGSTCVHLLSQDHDLVELIGEEEREKEKEKEIEKEIEQIKHSKDLATSLLEENDQIIIHPDQLEFQGREHLKNSTPPPEFISFFTRSLHT